MVSYPLGFPRCCGETVCSVSISGRLVRRSSDGRGCRGGMADAREPSMFENLRVVFDRLATDPDVRCVLLSGKGERAFTAGLDVWSPARYPHSYPAAPLLLRALRCQTTVDVAQVEAASKAGPLAALQDSSADPARKALAMRNHILHLQGCVTSIEKCLKRTAPPLPSRPHASPASELTPLPQKP